MWTWRRQRERRCEGRRGTLISQSPKEGPSSCRIGARKQAEAELRAGSSSGRRKAERRRSRAAWNIYIYHSTYKSVSCYKVGRNSTAVLSLNHFSSLQAMVTSNSEKTLFYKITIKKIHIYIYYIFLQKPEEIK